MKKIDLLFTTMLVSIASLSTQVRHNPFHEPILSFVSGQQAVNNHTFGDFSESERAAKAIILYA